MTAEPISFPCPCCGQPADKLMAFSLDPATGTVWALGKKTVLTDMETKALRLFIAAPHELVPFEDIIEAVWGERGDRPRVKQLVYRLTCKLMEIDAPCHIEARYGEGYVLNVGRKREG